MQRLQDQTLARNLLRENPKAAKCQVEDRVEMVINLFHFDQCHVLPIVPYGVQQCDVVFNTCNLFML